MSLQKWMAWPVFIVAHAYAQGGADDWVRIEAQKEVSAHLNGVEKAFAFFVNRKISPDADEEAAWLKTDILLQIPENQIERFKQERMPIGDQSYIVTDISIVIPMGIACEKALKRTGPFITYSERYGQGVVLESSQIGTEFPVDFNPDDAYEVAVVNMVCHDRQSALK